MNNGKIPRQFKRARKLPQVSMRGFNYREVLIPSSYCKNSLVKAWEVSYNESPIIVLPDLKEVKRFVREKAST